MASRAIGKLHVLEFPASKVLKLDKGSVSVVTTCQVVAVAELGDFSAEAAQEDSELIRVEGSDPCHSEVEGEHCGLVHPLQYRCREGFDFISCLRVACDK